MINLRKTIAAGLAVATLGAGLVASASPASAWGYRPWGWGVAAAAAGVAAAATAPVYYGYGACYFTRQPVVDVYGNFIGYQRVRHCR